MAADDAARRWRIKPRSELDLAGIDPTSRSGAPGDKAATKSATDVLREELSELQTRLWAESGQALLVVLQAMDAGGKDGAIRKVFSGLNPQGIRVEGFEAPTEEELAHDFLWRIRKRLPAPGMLGVFDRSHYEDVVVARVLDLVQRRTWMRRYDTINRFEAGLVAGGTTVVKCFLHISQEESKDRLLRRLDKPDKLWKFNPGDVDSRKLWDPMMEAYADALERCNTEAAPWYVVPADRKWYRNWAIMNLLVEQLEAMAVQWPEPDFDVEEQRRRLLASD